jgi:hypothetical protein
LNLKKKKFSSRTSRPISIKLGINHPWVTGILNSSNKGPGPLRRGDNLKNAKMGRVHLKIFFSRITEPEYLHESFLIQCTFKFLEIMVSGGQGGHNRETIFTYVYIEKKSSSEPAGQLQSNLVQTYRAWWEFNFIQMKVQVLFKGGIIT